MIPFVRSPYNYDVMQASDESALHCLDDSLTVQSDLVESDINTIVRRFGLTGQLPSDVRAPQYGDYSEVTDFRSALHAVREAEAEFMRLPAELRATFDNDPQLLLEFVADGRNKEQAEKLGLLRREPDVPVVRVMAEPEAKK